MQIETLDINSYKGGGGRLSSVKLRTINTQCEAFEGLDKSISRYDLLVLVKRVGKAAGFTPQMINLLDYYMAFTRDIDWTNGNRPIVFKAISATALEMGVSERQIQMLEKQLFDAGAITWHDSGNHKRYGRRCEKSGRILWGYGIELTPLAFLKTELENKLHEKQLYEQAWQETKRSISFYRRQIRSILNEAGVGQGCLTTNQVQKFEDRYTEVAVTIRAHQKLDILRDLLKRHESLYKELCDVSDTATHIDTIETPSIITLSEKPSSTDEQTCVHKESSTYPPFDKSNICSSSFHDGQGRDVEPPAPPSKQSDDRANELQKPSRSKETTIKATGLHLLSLRQLIAVSSERIQNQLPFDGQPLKHTDIVDAAYNVKNKLMISQQSWVQACDTLGRIGAAVCIILTDRAVNRPDNPVQKPGAYFKSMITRAESGQLNLQKSIMGAMKAEKRD
jgi:replication initiation protein RepC